MLSSLTTTAGILPSLLAVMVCTLSFFVVRERILLFSLIGLMGEMPVLKRGLAEKKGILSTKMRFLMGLISLLRFALSVTTKETSGSLDKSSSVDLTSGPNVS